MTGISTIDFALTDTSQFRSADVTFTGAASGSITAAGPVFMNAALTVGTQQFGKNDYDNLLNIFCVEAQCSDGGLDAQGSVTFRVSGLIPGQTTFAVATITAYTELDESILDVSASGGFSVTPIPEPSTLLFLTTAFVVIFVWLEYAAVT